MGSDNSKTSYPKRSKTTEKGNNRKIKTNTCRAYKKYPMPETFTDMCQMLGIEGIDHSIPESGEVTSSTRIIRKSTKTTGFHKGRKLKASGLNFKEIHGLLSKIKLRQLNEHENIHKLLNGSIEVEMELPFTSIIHAQNPTSPNNKLLKNLKPVNIKLPPVIKKSNSALRLISLKQIKFCTEKKFFNKDFQTKGNTKALLRKDI